MVGSVFWAHLRVQRRCRGCCLLPVAPGWRGTRLCDSCSTHLTYTHTHTGGYPEVALLGNERGTHKVVMQAALRGRRGGAYVCLCSCASSLKLVCFQCVWCLSTCVHTGMCVCSCMCFPCWCACAVYMVVCSNVLTCVLVCACVYTL